MSSLKNKRAKALSLIKSNRLQEAKSIYEKICRAHHEDAEAWTMVGAINGELGQFDEAIACCQKAVSIKPDYAKAHYNLAQVYMHQGYLEKAIDGYQAVLRKSPRHAESLNNIGYALETLQRPEEAIKYFRSAIHAKPDYIDALYNLAFLQYKLGQFSEAVSSFEKALKISPRDIKIIMGLALSYQGSDLLEQSLHYYCIATEVAPESSDAHYQVAFILLKLREYDKAAESCRRALDLRPDFTNALHLLGNVLLAQALPDEAERSYRKALEVDPKSVIIHQSILPTLTYSSNDLEKIFQEHKEWARIHAVPVAKNFAFSNIPDPERRLRIGYVSPDFCTHAAAFFIQPILLDHDTSAVDVYCYAHVPYPDNATSKFQCMAGAWRDITNLSDDEAAVLIHNDNIDILVDLAGHTENNRLLVFARKPAPIQITYLGYPNTSGIPVMDYLLTDWIVDPPGSEKYYTEELIRLDKCFACYTTSRMAPDVSPLPALSNGFVTFGSLNNLSKLNAPVIELWCRLLKKIPSTRMLLYRDTLRGSIKETIRNRFIAHGITEDRLELLNTLREGEDYLWPYGLVDIALDTFPWNGHTSTCDALLMGVPVITLQGNSHAGRMAASVLTNVGLDHCIASDFEEYIDIAAKLAGDIDSLSTLRANLRNMLMESPVCDSTSFTGKLENIYREIWRRWCNNSSGNICKDPA